MRNFLQILSVFIITTVTVTSVVACDNDANEAPNFYPVNSKTLPNNFQIVPKAEQGQQMSLNNYYQTDRLNLKWLVKQNLPDDLDRRFQIKLRDRLQETLGEPINFQDPTAINAMKQYITSLNEQLAYHAQQKDIDDYEQLVNRMLQYVQTQWSDANSFQAQKLDQTLNDSNAEWNVANKINRLFNYKWMGTPSQTANITPPNQSTQIIDALSYALAQKRWNIPIKQLFGNTTNQFPKGAPANAIAGVQLTMHFKNNDIDQGLVGSTTKFIVGRKWDNAFTAQAQYNAGFWATNQASSVFTHEFAHSIDLYEGNRYPIIKQNYNKNPLDRSIPYPSFTAINKFKSTDLMRQWVPQATNLPKNELLAAILMDWALIPGEYGRNIDPAESFAEAYAYWLLTPIESLNLNSGAWTANFNQARLGTAWAFWNNFFLHHYKSVFGPN